MPVITRAAFRRALGGLSTAEFVAFVADLWAARGYDTHVDGTTVSLRTGGERTTLLVRHDGSLAGRLRGTLRGRGGDDADLIVTSGPASRIAPPDGVEVLGADDLYELALYGVDRDACAGLFEEHLDRSPTVQSPGSRITARALAVGVAVTLAVLLVVLAAAAGPLAPAEPEPEPDTGPAATTAQPAEAFGTQRPTTTTGTETTARQSRPVELAYAHADALRNSSFTLVVNRTYRRPDGTTVARNQLTGAFAANKSRYAVTLTRHRPDLPDARGELWTGDGRSVFRKLTVANETSYELLRDRQRLPVRPADALAFDPVYAENLPGLLAAVESANVSLVNPMAVVDDPDWEPPTLGTVLAADRPQKTLVFRVEADLSEDAVSSFGSVGDAENATLTAIVDSEGRFYIYTFAYNTTFANESVRATRTVRYTRVGNTTVDRPEWYDEALENT